jgi:hypothetical protein
METKGDKILCNVKRHVESPCYHLRNECFFLALVSFNKDGFGFIHCPLGYFLPTFSFFGKYR